MAYNRSRKTKDKNQLSQRDMDRLSESTDNLASLLGTMAEQMMISCTSNDISIYTKLHSEYRMSVKERASWKRDDAQPEPASMDRRPSPHRV